MYILIDNNCESKPKILAISKDKKKIQDRLEEIAYDNYYWMSIKDIQDMLHCGNVYDPDDRDGLSVCIIEADLDKLTL